MAWATILMALISGIGALAKYLSERQLINTAQAAVAADALKRVQDALRAGDAVDVSPNGVRSDDPDERPD